MSHPIRYFVPVIAALALSACGAGVPGTPHSATITVTSSPGDCWIGEFGTKEGRGCGPKTFQVVSTDIIDVTAQKATAGRWTLELTMTENGKVINQQHTTGNYGIVEVTEQQRGVNDDGV